MKRLVIIVLALSLLVLGMSATVYAGKPDNPPGNPDKVTGKPDNPPGNPDNLTGKPDNPGNTDHSATPATPATPADPKNGQPATPATPATPAHKAESDNLKMVHENNGWGKPDWAGQKTGPPKCLGDSSPSNFSCETIFCSEEAVDCEGIDVDMVCCSWDLLEGAAKYSVDFDVHVSVECEEGATVEQCSGDPADYVMPIDFSTNECGEDYIVGCAEIDSTFAMCINLAEFQAEDTPGDYMTEESVSADAKVKGLVDKKEEEMRCRQNNEWTELETPFDLVAPEPVVE